MSAGTGSRRCCLISRRSRKRRKLVGAYGSGASMGRCRGGEEDDGWSSHVEQARKTLDSIRAGKEHLGVPPDDLFDVLALAASAAPATAAMRAYARASRSDPAMCLPSA